MDLLTIVNTEGRACKDSSLKKGFLYWNACSLKRRVDISDCEEPNQLKTRLQVTSDTPTDIDAATKLLFLQLTMQNHLNCKVVTELVNIKNTCDTSGPAAIFI